METKTPDAILHYKALNASIADCEAVTGETPSMITLPRNMFNALAQELESLPATPINARLNKTAMTYNGIDIRIEEEDEH